MPSEANRPGSSTALNALAVLAILFLVATALYVARAIFIPLAMAVFCAFVLTPLVGFLERRRLGRVPSVIIVMAVALLVVGATGTVVVRQMVGLTRSLGEPAYAQNIMKKVDSLKRAVSADEGSRLGELWDYVAETFSAAPKGEDIPGEPERVVVQTGPSWVTRVQGLLSPAAEALGQAALTFILVVFMLLKREDLRNRVIRLLGSGQITTTTKAVDETSQRLSRYLLAQFLLNAAFGLVIMGGLLVMRVPYAPLWGFVAFLMRYVPYIGTWIGVIPPALFTFAVSEGWGKPIGVVVLFLGLEALCNNIFEPLLYGSRLGLSEVAQLVATAFWAFLWGPVGMILAWPLTTCLLMIGKYVPRLRFLNILLGDEPVLSPRVAVYQRLMARDQDEAAQIVEKELGTRPVEQVFDDLLIPVLAAARRDTAAGRLTQDDLRFITAAIHDVAEEVVEVHPPDSPPVSAPVRVVLLPAKDEADRAAADLFARLLEPSVWEVEVAPANALTSEALELVEKLSPALVVIAALPPGGLTHTRYLCKRLRQRGAEVKIIVGRWASSEDDAAGWDQLRTAGADEVTASVEATRTYVLSWRAVLAGDPGAAPPEPERKGPRNLVGTVSA